MPTLRQIIPDGAVRSGKNTSGVTIAKCRVVKRHTVQDEVRLPAAATDAILGVTMADIEDGKTGDVQTRGQAICTAGAAIAVGAQLKCDNAGKVLTHDAGAGANQSVIGIANSAAGADGDLLEVELAGPGVIKQG